MNQKPVVIIGAGLAGLTAATYLHRHGQPVIVLEAGKQVAGLARSERDPEGFTYDTGAHFITNRLAAAVGISASCRPMPRYGETVWHRGRAFAYPFGLMKSPRYVASAAAAKLRGMYGPKSRTAIEFYRRQYGCKLADEIALPLTEAWSGATGGELAASVADKFATSLPRTILLKTVARISKRTVAVGYSGTITESQHVWHVYPEGGIGTVCERLAEEVMPSIQLESPAEAILVENDRVIGVRVKGDTLAARAVISTAPVHVLAKLIRGSDRLAYLARFQYRAMVFVNMKFEGACGLPEVVT